MTQTRDDGGPAFATGNHEQGGQAGMDLRDWFAGQALAGQLAGHVTGSFDAENTALVAYEIADAMLAARKGGDT